LTTADISSPASATPGASRPVVVTRPLAQAQAFAAQVAQAGRQPEIFPLLAIAPVPDRQLLQAYFDDLPSYALVVFVSPNAIDAAFSCISAWPPAVAIGIVGEGSRLALQAHGVTAANAMIVGPRNPAKMDSEELLLALDLESLRGKRALIVRGQAGRDFLTDTLRAHQIEVVHATAYLRTVPQLDEAARRRLQALLEADSVWVITSSEALRNLVGMTNSLRNALSGEGFVVKLQRSKILVPHHRIADTARSLGFSDVTLTGSGDERLIAALQSCP